MNRATKRTYLIQGIPLLAFFVGVIWSVVTEKPVWVSFLFLIFYLLIVMVLPNTQSAEMRSAIIISCHLSGGDSDDFADFDKLSRQIEAVCKKSKLGEFDGTGIGDDAAEIFLYGSNARKLYAVVKPVLVVSTLKPFQVTLQFGDSEKNLKQKELQIF